jgi:UDP:flavonoid glycosyltransferase YjiC (YdhE family)
VNVLLCPMSDPGYLYPAIPVGLELRRRGAWVHVLGRARMASLLAESGLPYLEAESYAAAGAFNVRRWTDEAAAGQYQAVLRAALDVQADVLVTSLLCHGALLAAETLDLPVVVIGLAAYLWEYPAGGEPERPLERRWRTRDMLRFYDLAREQAGLPVRSPSAPDNPLIGTALLLRGDPVLEYPGAVLPERVHHVGPCLWEPTADPGLLEEISDRLARTEKPVVYVHLGRIFNGTSPWPRINAAFTDGPFQAVVELGRTSDPRPAPEADVTVVRMPWMGPVIERAGLVLTSATSAPVLNALVRGRALGVSPAGSEQPLLAEACVRAGVAVRVPNTLDRDPIDIVRDAWRHDGLRSRAAELGRELAAANGAGRAADIIQLTVTGRPMTVSSA